MKLKSKEARLRYAENTLESLWSRTILEHQIGIDFYKELDKVKSLYGLG